jgi:dihydroorotate dehydrogenase
MGCLSRLAAAPGLLRILAGPPAAGIERTVFGIRFPNPVGLAAGFDKNAVALPAWEALGFGFAEAGTVTAHAQPGNPRPRIFRVPSHGALINRLGFNNAGADLVARQLMRLKQRGGWPRIPIGLNIGKSKATPLEEAAGDYGYSFRALFEYGDYFVLNVSSPNTPGLRTLQDAAALAEILRAVQSDNFARPAPKPVLVKIAPDLPLDRIEEILGLAADHRLAGIVATNTTIDQSEVSEGLRTEGGLSGRPLREKSTEIIRFIAAKSKLPIIGVGGIFDADSALEKLDAGASLIQIYTGYVYRGPALPGEICRAVAWRSRRG